MIQGPFTTHIFTIGCDVPQNEKWGKSPPLNDSCHCLLVPKGSCRLANSCEEMY